MNFQSLINKRKINKEDGTRIVDLFSTTFRPTPEGFMNQDLFEVTDDYVMRPDLISFEYYGSPDYADAILKVNNISNPFSIYPGQVLVIPRLDDIKAYYTIPENSKAEEKESNGVKAQFLDESKMSEKDKSRKKYLEDKAKKSKTGASEIVPTNILRSDEDPIRRKDNKFILGS